jgi:hypothetical protein
VVGPSPGSGEAEAPPRLRSSLSSGVEVESDPRVGRGGDHCLRPRPSPSPGVGRGGVRRLPGPRPSPSPGVGEAEFVVFRGQGRVRALGSGEAEFVVFRGRGQVRALGSGEAEFVVFRGRGRVRALGSGKVELPMAPEAGLGCCQPHSVEWHSSRSGACGAVFLSGRSVERRSDCGHFGSVD